MELVEIFLLLQIKSTMLNDQWMSHIAVKKKKNTQNKQTKIMYLKLIYLSENES